MSRVILVTGATGKQGGAVIDALLALKNVKFTILAVTRDPSSPSAKRLIAKSNSIKLVKGNLNDAPAIFAEAKKVHDQSIWGVFSVQVSMGTGVTVVGEIEQGKALIDQSVRDGVSHFVYSSVERGGDEVSWDEPTSVPHFQSKYHIERHLRDVTIRGRLGHRMRWTIVRPVGFMDNLKADFPSQVFVAALHNWMGSKPNQWVATSDIGVFVAKAFEDWEHWDQKAIGIAGDELTFDELSATFQRVTGHPIPEAHSWLGSILTYVVTEVRLMIGWFVSDGYKADIAARREDHPDLLTVEDWLRKANPSGNSGQ